MAKENAMGWWQASMLALTKAMPTLNTTKETLQGMIHKNVRKGSALFTDENPSYDGVVNRHYAVNHSVKEYVATHANGIESVWAVLKRGHNGTYRHISKKHLSRYADEFACRLNDGNCEADTIDRMEAMAKGIAGKRITPKELIQ